MIVLQEGDEWIAACLAAACAQSLKPAHVTLIDLMGAIAPNDKTAADLAARNPGVQVLRPPSPLGTAACFNRAAALTRQSDYLLLLDSHAIPALDALERLAAAWADHPNVAVMGCKILGGDVETIAHLGSDMRGNAIPRHFGAGQRDTGQYRGVRDALSVQGAALAVRNDVWCELGGLDESFWPAHFEVADLCFRARGALWRVAVACDATVTYFGRRVPDELNAAERAIFFRNRTRFLLKHYRMREWCLRFAVDELRWILSPASRNMRWTALRALTGGILFPRRHAPQTVQE
jgi:GT2 family glycosyltransferase